MLCFTTNATAQEWHASLPSHLQFNEENLETQVTMFETSSNSGAWSFCFMHAMYPCCYLAVLEVRSAARRWDMLLSPLPPLISVNHIFLQGEGTLTEPIPWVREQLNMIFNAAGTRAKTSILCTYLRSTALRECRRQASDKHLHSQTLVEPHAYVHRAAISGLRALGKIYTLASLGTYCADRRRAWTS